MSIPLIPSFFVSDAPLALSIQPSVPLKKRWFRTKQFFLIIIHVFVPFPIVCASNAQWRFLVRF